MDELKHFHRGIWVGRDEDVDPEFLEQVKVWLEPVPVPILSSIDRNGGYIWLVRRMSERFSWKYPPYGRTSVDEWSETPGLYFDSIACLVLSQEWIEPGTKSWVRYRCSYSLLHELGHAFDYCGCDKRPSQDPDFRKAYLRDRNALSDLLRKKLAYFVHPWAAGALEVFAECFAANFTDNLELTLDRSPAYPLFVSSFPRSLNHVTSMLGHLARSEEAA